MQQVLPGLWIGDYTAASNHALLEEHGIACVVSSSELSPPLGLAPAPPESYQADSHPP